MSRSPIATVSAAIASFAVLGPTRDVACACGYEDPTMVYQAILTWNYPEALHVNGAIWSAQQAGDLPMPDRERLLAQGKLRERLNQAAFERALDALLALGGAFGEVDPAADHPDVALVLIETMLWARFVRTDDGVEVREHAVGAEAGDLVIVTDEPVLLAIERGELTVAEASERGLLRLYGPSDQSAAFLEAHGAIGAEPLARVAHRDQHADEASHDASESRHDEDGEAPAAEGADTP